MGKKNRYFDAYGIYDGTSEDATESPQIIDNVEGNELFEELRPVGSLPFLSLLVVPPSIGGFLFGYDIGGTSSSLIQNAYQNQNLSQTFQMNELTQEIIISESMIGAILGSILVFYTGDYLSRRGVLMMAAAFYFGGALIEGASFNLLSLFIGRTLYGMAMGFTMHSSPLYISEISPAKYRGFFNSIRECFILLGLLVGYFQGFIFEEFYEGWRYIYYFATIPSFILFISMYFVYPSPRWLILKALKQNNNLNNNENIINYDNYNSTDESDYEIYNSNKYSNIYNNNNNSNKINKINKIKEEEEKKKLKISIRKKYIEKAKISLSKIRRLPVDVIQFEINEIIDSLSYQLNSNFSFFDFFRYKSLSRSLFIGCIFVIFQQVFYLFIFIYFFLFNIYFLFYCLL